MTTYVATITHDDGDLNVMIEGAGSSPDDRASIAWALRAAADLVEHGEVVGCAAGEAPVDRPVRPGPEAHKLTDRQIADMAFAVLREHNDNRLWRALTYDSGPYDVTTPTLALCHLARVFFAAGVAAALAGCVDMVQPPDIAVAEELCAKRGGYAHAQRWERGTVLDINCKDGTQLQVRLPKKA